jgi:hypothetical protein
MDYANGDMKPRSATSPAVALALAIAGALGIAMALSSCGKNRDAMRGATVEQLLSAYGAGAMFDASPLRSDLVRYGYVEGFEEVWFYVDRDTRKVVGWRATKLLTSFPPASSLVGLDEAGIVGILGSPSLIVDEGDDRVFFYNVARQTGPFSPFAFESYSRIVYFTGGRASTVAPVDR